MKFAAKILAVTIVAPAVLVSALAQVRPHKVCRYNRYHHRVAAG